MRCRSSSHLPTASAASTTIFTCTSLFYGVVWLVWVWMHVDDRRVIESSDGGSSADRSTQHVLLIYRPPGTRVHMHPRTAGGRCGSPHSAPPAPASPGSRRCSGPHMSPAAPRRRRPCTPRPPPRPLLDVNEALYARGTGGQRVASERKGPSTQEQADPLLSSPICQTVRALNSYADRGRVDQIRAHSIDSHHPPPLDPKC